MLPDQKWNGVRLLATAPEVQRGLRIPAPPWLARDSSAAAKRYPNGRAECDFVLPGEWAVGVKLARPFGDNGKPAERWSENLLYPYPGNTSSLGDCLKLLNSDFPEREGRVGNRL